MREVTGKHGYAKIFTDVVDEASLSQVQLLLDQEFVTGSQIRLMPDIHAGAGCTIGTTMTVLNTIVPNLVGVDIGCGMLCVKLKEKEIDLEKLDRVIRKKVPSGFNIHGASQDPFLNYHLRELHCFEHINLDRAEKSLGTLGGGNHFIEVDRDDEDNLYLVIHTGSRHLGLEVAQYYQKMAYESMGELPKREVRAIVDAMKLEGRRKEIESTLAALKKERQQSVPKELAFLTGELFAQYLHDINIIQQFASTNRREIFYKIANEIGLDTWGAERFETIHNYIDVNEMILRKGAVSAKAGERLIIPINMRDGSLICIGKGNPDWNFSAPHGAGRLMSRSKAKKVFTMDEFKSEMSDVFTTSVDTSTLDECPMAYKSMDDIIKNIGDTVDIEKIITPIYNFKAGGD